MRSTEEGKRNKYVLKGTTNEVVGGGMTHY